MECVGIRLELRRHALMRHVARSAVGVARAAQPVPLQYSVRGTPGLGR